MRGFTRTKLRWPTRRLNDDWFDVGGGVMLVPGVAVVAGVGIGDMARVVKKKCGKKKFWHLT